MTNGTKPRGFSATGRVRRAHWRDVIVARRAARRATATRALYDALRDGPRRSGTRAVLPLPSDRVRMNLLPVT